MIIPFLLPPVHITITCAIGLSRSREKRLVLPAETTGRRVRQRNETVMATGASVSTV